MVEERSFLRQLSLEPGNTAAALVYADWLEEQGDPRAPFMRICCDTQLDSNDFSILQPVAESGWWEWFAARGWHPPHFRFTLDHRGIPHRCTVNIAALATHGASVLDALPGMYTSCALAYGQDVIQLLRSDASRLLRSAHFSFCRTLQSASERTLEPMTNALMNMENFPDLHTLVVEHMHNSIGRILGSQRAHVLRAFGARRCLSVRPVIDRLRTGLPLQLGILQLQDCNCCDQDVSSIIEGGRHLTHLLLANNRITVEGAMRIVRALSTRSSTLRHLDLRRNNIQQADFDTLHANAQPDMRLDLAERPAEIF